MRKVININMVSNPKYLVLGNYWRYAKAQVRKFLPHNLIVDRKIRSVGFEQLSVLRNVKIRKFDIDGTKYRDWVSTYFPNWNIFGDIRHKKLIEFFTSFEMVSADMVDAYMDAAGGSYTYIDKLTTCKELYLQDIRIPDSLKQRLGLAVQYIQCDANNINLPDGILDGVSCHHSFEHFQGESDMLFIREVQRLLRKGGVCCVIPIFIAKEYAEIFGSCRFQKTFDPRATLIVDPTARIPGGTSSGNFARVYDITAFQERVIDYIDRLKFNVTLFELSMDGSMVPDLSLPCHKYVTAVNFPYRALVIERKK